MKKCAVTGKTSKMGGGYSNRTRATQFNPTGKRRRKTSVQKRRIFVAELNKTFILPISNAGIRTINKRGAYITLKKAGLIK